jgi:hypothetical protein
MPYFSKYHVREQPASALLGPMRATLLELERRAQHYVDRVNMEPADADTLRAAHDAIAGAREAVERLWQQCGQSAPAAGQGQGAAR